MAEQAVRQRSTAARVALAVCAALAFAGASVYTPCGPLWAFIADLVPRNVVGESMALVNSAGAIGRPLERLPDADGILLSDHSMVEKEGHASLKG